MDLMETNKCFLKRQPKKSESGKKRRGKFSRGHIDDVGLVGMRMSKVGFKGNSYTQQARLERERASVVTATTAKNK
jgi:hypothetical protein